jgi:hypothetical protein
MFKKGQSGNGNGRPPGARNKVQTELRDKIKLFLDGNFDAIQNDFDKLDPVQKLAFYERLLKFAVPVMSSQNIQIDFDELDESQLDEVINRLISRQ